MRDGTLAAALILLVILAGTMFGIGYEIGKNQQLAHMREAYRICMLSHDEIVSTSEEACGQALDDTNTHFACDANRCWLEVR